jgi:hypothetical protein
VPAAMPTTSDTKKTSQPVIVNFPIGRLYPRETATVSPLFGPGGRVGYDGGMLRRALGYFLIACGLFTALFAILFLAQHRGPPAAVLILASVALLLFIAGGRFSELIRQ